jgi:hypothetical protein
MVISIGTVPIGTLRDVQSAGTPVAGGGNKIINFSAGGATAGPPGTVNVSVTGPPGPPGPSGGTGPTGPAGPPGPGFSNFSSSSTTGTLPGGAGTFTQNFGIGFSWKMASGTINQTTEGAFADGMGITSISGVNTTNVAVNITYTNNGVPSANYIISYAAAG